MTSKKLLTMFGIVILISFASVGWIVFSTQNPILLARARLHYLQAVVNNTNFETGPCLGTIDNDWVLDIAHVPRLQIDDLVKNQCEQYRTGKVHHLIEMSPTGEIIFVH